MLIFYSRYTEPWHSDIFDFLDLRKNSGKEELRARDLFLGLWIPDLFMKRTCFHKFCFVRLSSTLILILFGLQASKLTKIGHFFVQTKLKDCGILMARSLKNCMRSTSDKGKPERLFRLKSFGSLFWTPKLRLVCHISFIKVGIHIYKYRMVIIKI
jgi:hypothetical protein